MEAANLAKRISRSPGRWALLAVPGAVVLVLGLVVSSSAASHPGSAHPGEMYGVAALAASNAWSVGDYLP